MKSYTPRELRNAIVLAVVVTATVVVALVDPSCQRVTSSPSTGPSRTIFPP